MNVLLKVLTTIGALCLSVPSIAEVQESATAPEVLQKTHEAADYLIKEGEKGIDSFKSDNSRSHWKTDGYIFVIDCEHGMMMAHPNLKVAGASLATIHDSLGLYLAKPFCENGRRSNGGWLEEHIPKPGQTKVMRKLIYIRPVPGTSYQVGSGFFDDTISIEDLNKLADAQ